MEVLNERHAPDVSAERAMSLINIEVESLSRVIVIKVAVESWVCAGRRVIGVREEIHWCTLFLSLARPTVERTFSDPQTHAFPPTHETCSKLICTLLNGEAGCRRRIIK